MTRRHIEGFGGRVEKIVGNVMFGVFGAPMTHEDDAERAVRAALRIREEVQLRRRDDPSSLAVRIGIATGEVVVSLGLGPRIGERVTGDVVNTASRLQSVASPDGIVVAVSTFLADDLDTMLVHLDAFTASTASQPTFRTGFMPLAVRLLARADERERAATLLDIDEHAGGSSRRLRLSYDTGRAAFEETWGDPSVALDLHAEIVAAWEA